MQNRNIHSDLVAILERITTNLKELKNFQEERLKVVPNVQDSRTDPILSRINTDLNTAKPIIQAL